MAKDIEIPGYKILVPNSVWGKDVGAFTWPTGVQLHATKIMEICRYDTPDQQEFLDSVQRIAKDYNPVTSLNEKPAKKGESPLSQIMGQLFTPSEIERIASGVPEVMEDLKKHYLETMLVGNVLPGRGYIQIVTSTVPNKILDAAKAQIKEFGTAAYDDLGKEIGAEFSSIQIMLRAKDLPPDIANIEFLLQNGVRESYALSARPLEIDYKIVVENVKLLYPVLYSPTKIRKICDRGELLNRNLVIGTIQRTAQSRKSRMGGIMLILNPTAQQQMPEEGKKDNKDYLSPFSEN